MNLLYLFQGDCKNDFCNSTLPDCKTKIIIPQIGCPFSHPDKLCLINKTIYGIRIIPHHWLYKITVTLSYMLPTASHNNPYAYKYVWSPLGGGGSTLSYMFITIYNLDNLMMWRKMFERIYHQRSKSTGHDINTGYLAHNLSGPHTCKATFIFICASQKFLSTHRKAWVLVLEARTPLSHLFIQYTNLLPP